MVTSQRPTPSHPVLRRTEVVALRFGGLLPSAALWEAGVPPHSLQRLCVEGVLHCIRRGVYVTEERWRRADAGERYRLLVRATALVAHSQPVFSHQSAAVLHGLPIIGGWPDTVHTITSGASGGSRNRFTTGHQGPAPEVVETTSGCQVTSLARTVVDVAASSSLLVGVTMLDHALRVETERAARERGRGPREGGLAAPRPTGVTKEELYCELDAVNPRTGRRRAEQAIAFASPLAANPGETLSRVRIFELGFEVPELQVRFPDILGGDAWVDFFWRGVRKIGEFDGFLKYGSGPVLGDRDPSAVVWAEKQREDALRARVNSFDRWGWDLAYSAARFFAFLTERGVPRA
ncbi:type IV toxin-antitoxin system AbiEi family antitoxin domain-containing protein [Cryobacterium arcticum]|uniref:Transcriptional regulator, AbiEi antitoxin, Type IV TA system n=1 Tax=Cryobacterium arcticum TaxID=670052 RepID=A0A1B1BFR6_9MICO|nr:hypothetical protein [Cryobacterium arcticum]ANP71326.1 hypothetical protein PA27867_0352 [Cryobacterium arcticum]